MDLQSGADLPAPPDVVFAEVVDLGTYPAWLTLVQRADRLERREDEPGPAWSVDLGGRIGPIRRTKQVRMVRVEGRPPRLVRFERREHDGLAHSAWVLSAAV
ncbi:MAG: SRPBCC family protein, partial [Acidimicrobiales bacterium]